MDGGGFFELTRSKFLALASKPFVGIGLGWKSVCEQWKFPQIFT